MDKIVLDNKSFKALSAQSRVGILKGLKERRMTLSELSNKLALRSSTVKEHCDLLLGAELVKKIDEGRKWKYYELTDKGKQIIEPNIFMEAKVLVMLSLTMIIFSSILLFSAQGLFLENNLNNNLMTDNQLEMFGTKTTDTQMIASIPSNEQEADATPNQSPYLNVDYNLFSVTVILALVIGVFAGWIVGRKI